MKKKLVKTATSFNKKKINILVTGGAGYIGSVFCSYLKENYPNIFKVFVIDNLSSGKRKYLNFDKFYKFDLKSNSKLNNFFANNKIDTVVHLAGFTNLREKSSQKFYMNNFLVTKNLISKLVKFKIKKLIFSSTASVYGNPNKTPIKETFDTNPISYYGKSKLKAENYIKKYSKNNYSCITFRFFNASGANVYQPIGEDKDPPQHLIPIILKGFLKKKKVKIFNGFNTYDGTGVRDYIHVDDIALALVKGIKYLDYIKVNYEVINLGSGKGVSSLSILKKLEVLLNKNICYSFSKKKIGEPDVLLASISKAKQKINWFPQKKITRILKDAFYWEKYICK